MDKGVILSPRVSLFYAVKSHTGLVTDVVIEFKFTLIKT